jgi:hypothetical protein
MVFENGVLRGIFGAKGEPILRVLDCIVSISFGVCLILWLF